MPRVTYADLGPTHEYIYQNFEKRIFSFADIPADLKFIGLAQSMKSKGLIVQVRPISSPYKKNIWKLTPKGIRWAEKKFVGVDSPLPGAEKADVS